MASSRTTPDRIFVGLRPSPQLWDAVSRAGGEPTTDVTEARAAVWTGGSPDELAELLHPDIEWLQLPSAGIERYTAAGIITPDKVITNASPAYADTVAEHTLALLLACARRLHEFSAHQTWATLDIERFRGSTVAIIGCGRIGRALISLMAPFGTTVLASNRSGRPVDGAAETVTPDGHLDIIRRADYVVVAAPATTQTEHLIGTEEFEAMRGTAHIVNIARGILIDTEALVDAIRNGSIRGAALDVTDPEPLPDGHALWAMPEVLITPHMANPDAWDAALLAPLVEDNVRRFLGGDTLTGVVDPDRGY